MDIDLTFPNPLARLTRILLAVDAARGTKARALDQPHAAESRSGPPTESDSARRDDLERLALTRCERALEERVDPLGFLALERSQSGSP